MPETGKNPLCVVLISYNRREYLKQAIGSILDQSDRSFDLLIIDNGSTDGSWELIRNTKWAVHGRVDLVRYEMNLGALGVGQRLGELLLSPWTTILCDDDWLGPHFVESMVPYLSDPPRGLVITGHARVDAQGMVHRVCDRGTERLEAGRSLREFRQQRLEVAGISGFAVPSRFLQDGRFPLGYPNGFLEDTMLCVRALAEGGATVVQGVEYYRREWAGCESQRPGRLADWAMAHALFTRDVEQVLKDADVDRGIRTAWQGRGLLLHLAFFGRGVLLHNMSFREFRRYLAFARDYSLTEFMRAILAAVFFALRIGPVARGFRMMDDWHSRRLKAAKA